MSVAMKAEPTQADAERVLLAAAAAFRAALGERLLAAYALGSLAHGGFSPLVSDIDLGLVVEDPIRPDDARLIEVVAQSQKVAGRPLSERLSVFWGTPNSLAASGEGGRFPALDRLDLLENGRLLVGVDMRSGMPRPSAFELIVAGAEFAVEFLAGVRWAASGGQSGLGSMQAARQDAVEEVRRPELLIAAGARRLTKLVLFPVRFMFTAATGRVGTNAQAAEWYLTRNAAPSKRLVRAALGWRMGEPIDDDEVADLLRKDMVPLYVYYIDDHIARLDGLGKVELARAFVDWRARLEA
jgi:predicted nucleotidyltransferase